MSAEAERARQEFLAGKRRPLAAPKPQTAEQRIAHIDARLAGNAVPGTARMFPREVHESEDESPTRPRRVPPPEPARPARWLARHNAVKPLAEAPTCPPGGARPVSGIPEWMAELSPEDRRAMFQSRPTRGTSDFTRMGLEADAKRLRTELAALAQEAEQAKMPELAAKLRAAVEALSA